MNDEITPEEAAQIEAVAENPIITPADPARWPLLEVPSQAVQFPLDNTAIEQLEKMNSILMELGEEAAGLAAVQIGYPKQIFLLNEDGNIRAFINPQILSRSGELKWDIEGCLSIPNTPARIPL
jgi:peptide deformylase